MKTNEELLKIANEIGSILFKEHVPIQQGVIMLLSMGVQLHVRHMTDDFSRDDFLRDIGIIYDNNYASIKDGERAEQPGALGQEGKAPCNTKAPRKRPVRLDIRSGDAAVCGDFDEGGP